MAKRKNKKRNQETPKIVKAVEAVEETVVEETVVSVTTTQKPVTTTPQSSEKAKKFLQNVQEKQIEQIHDWLDSIEESMLLTKDILINTTNNKEESFALKRIQKLYHQLNLIKNIKKGKTVIMGYNKKKLQN